MRPPVTRKGSADYLASLPEGTARHHYNDARCGCPVPRPRAVSPVLRCDGLAFPGTSCAQSRSSRLGAEFRWNAKGRPRAPFEKQ